MAHRSDGCFSSPRALVDPVPPKKLKKEELKTSADRLSTQRRPVVQLPPLVERRVLSQDIMTKSLDRLYANSITHKKKMLEELDKKANPDMVRHVQLDTDTLENAFSRVYSQSVERKKETLKKLKQKYLARNADLKKLSPEELAESNKRLYSECLDTTRQKQEKLYEKYILASAPHFPKLSADQVKSSADRLSQKKPSSV